MKYATVVLDPGPEGFYQGYQSVTEKSEMTWERIHYLNLLDDGTMVGLYQLRGNRDGVQEGLEERPRVLNYEITGTHDILLYVHEEATDPVKTLLSKLNEFELILDMPLEFLTDGSVRVTLIGNATSLREGLTEAAESVEAHLEETGEYHHELGDPVSSLTSRQYQILRAAVETGYYEVPRQATYDDIAEEIGLSKATVGEHLQKIEARVLSGLLR